MMSLPKNLLLATAIVATLAACKRTPAPDRSLENATGSSGSVSQEPVAPAPVAPAKYSLKAPTSGKIELESILGFDGKLVLVEVKMHQERLNADKSATASVLLTNLKAKPEGDLDSTNAKIEKDLLDVDSLEIEISPAAEISLVDGSAQKYAHVKYTIKADSQMGESTLKSEGEQLIEEGVKTEAYRVAGAKNLIEVIRTKQLSVQGSEEKITQTVSLIYKLIVNNSQIFMNQADTSEKEGL